MRSNIVPMPTETYAFFRQEESGECFHQIPLNGKRYEPKTEDI